jgi:clumping factor A
MRKRITLIAGLSIVFLLLSIYGTPYVNGQSSTANSSPGDNETSSTNSALKTENLDPFELKDSSNSANIDNSNDPAQSDDESSADSKSDDESSADSKSDDESSADSKSDDDDESSADSNSDPFTANDRSSADSKNDDSDKDGSDDDKSSKDDKESKKLPFP